MVYGKDLTVAVVGCGYWGAKHLRVLTTTLGVEHVIAVDPDAARLGNIRCAAPGVAVERSLDAALDDIDAAVIAAPLRSHFGLAASLLRAGKHVLVEKPMTSTSRQAELLIDLAAAQGLVLMAGHTFEYNAAVQMLESLVASDELGSIYYIDAARLNLGIYRPDANVVWDLAAHDISIVNMLLRDVPVTVQAWAARHANAAREDVGYVRLTYASGVTAQLHVSWLDPCKVRRVTVVGSKRMAVYNDLDDEKRLRVYDKGVLLPEVGAAGEVPLTYRYGGITCPHIEFVEPLATEDAHFVSCILNDTPCRSDGWSGLAVVRVLEAAQNSLRMGAPVMVVPTPAPAVRRREPVSIAG